MINAPCKDCIKRQLGCHSTCQDYKQFRKERDFVNQQRRQQQLIEQAHIDSIRRQLKKSNKH